MAKKPTKKQQAEFIKIQRDRLNVIMQGLAPATLDLLKSDVGQALLWWALSRRVELLGITNKVMLTTEFLDVLPQVDTVEFPKPIIAGAMIETTEDILKLGRQTGVTGFVDDVIDTITFTSVGKTTGQFYNRFWPPVGLSRQIKYDEREEEIRKLYPLENGETYIDAKCRDPNTGLFSEKRCPQ